MGELAANPVCSTKPTIGHLRRVVEMLALGFSCFTLTSKKLELSVHRIKSATNQWVCPGENITPRSRRSKLRVQGGGIPLGLYIDARRSQGCPPSFPPVANNAPMAAATALMSRCPAAVLVKEFVSEATKLTFNPCLYLIGCV
mmetsp:Transcript_32619/g.82239  ORF Transcript_32619/g.82239 Transcript_32619/m.82239 type:complete len:143 (+) Transcript_32619:977-1405(+)